MSSSRHRQDPLEQLFNLLETRKLQQGHVKQVARFLDKYPDIPRNALHEGLTVFHVCLLRTTEENSARARCLCLLVELLVERGFLWHLPAEAGCAVEWPAPGKGTRKYRVQFRGLSVMECVSRFAALGKAALDLCAPGLAMAVGFFTDLGHRLAAQQDEDGDTNMTDARPRGRKKKHDHQHQHHHHGAQKTCLLPRDMQAQQAQSTQLFVEVLADAFGTMETLARTVLGSSQAHPAITEAMNIAAVQCVNGVGALATKLKHEGNTTGLRLGAKRLDDFKAKIEHDDRAWGLLEPMLAYLEDATAGKRTKDLPMLRQADWTSAAVNGGLAYANGGGHEAESTMAKVAADPAQWGRAHAKEASRHRPGSRRAAKSMQRDEDFYAASHGKPQDMYRSRDDGFKPMGPGMERDVFG